MPFRFKLLAREHVPLPHWLLATECPGSLAQVASATTPPFHIRLIISRRKTPVTATCFHLRVANLATTELSVVLGLWSALANLLRLRPSQRVNSQVVTASASKNHADFAAQLSRLKFPLWAGWVRESLSSDWLCRCNGRIEDRITPFLFRPKRALVALAFARFVSACSRFRAIGSPKLIHALLMRLLLRLSRLLRGLKIAVDRAKLSTRVCVLQLIFA